MSIASTSDRPGSASTGAADPGSASTGAAGSQTLLRESPSGPPLPAKASKASSKASSNGSRGAPNVVRVKAAGAAATTTRATAKTLAPAVAQVAARTVPYATMDALRAKVTGLFATDTGRIARLFDDPSLRDQRFPLSGDAVFYDLTTTSLGQVLFKPLGTSSTDLGDTQEEGGDVVLRREFRDHSREINVGRNTADRGMWGSLMTAMVHAWDTNVDETHGIAHSLMSGSR